MTRARVTPKHRRGGGVEEVRNPLGPNATRHAVCPCADPSTVCIAIDQLQFRGTRRTQSGMHDLLILDAPVVAPSIGVDAATARHLWRESFHRVGVRIRDGVVRRQCVLLTRRNAFLNCGIRNGRNRPVVDRALQRIRKRMRRCRCPPSS